MSIVNKLTIFSTCKPFVGQDDINQRTALYSWSRIRASYIVLIGDEKGTREIAKEYGYAWIKDVQRGEDIGKASSAPLLDDLFRLGISAADTDVVCYVNSDIILSQSFAYQILKMLGAKEDEAFIIGSRREFKLLNVIENGKGIDKLFEEKDKITWRGNGAAGADYFAFHSNFFENKIHIPKFLVGRFSWDSWLMWVAMFLSSKPINATEKIPVLHPEHAYTTIGYDGFDAGAYNRELAPEQFVASNDRRWESTTLRNRSRSVQRNNSQVDRETMIARKRAGANMFKPR